MGRDSRTCEADMPTVFIAGATGYLGHYLCSEYRARGWIVVALARDLQHALDLDADRLVEAEATRPETLVHQLGDVDLVVSCLGITRQKDNLSYWDVDFKANLNLLHEALGAKVPRFAYVHVVAANHMQGVPLIDAKSAFVKALQTADIQSHIIAPSGYFSDMVDFYKMAKSGRAWLFGSGDLRLNPIHGADLAVATADMIAEDQRWLDVGGPEVFTQKTLAAAAFEAMGKKPRIVHLPDRLRRAALWLLPKVMPATKAGPIVFFLTAFGTDMVGACRGTHSLRAHFKNLARQDG